MIESEDKAGADGVGNGKGDGVGREVDLAVVQKDGRDDGGEAKVETRPHFAVFHFNG